MCVKRVRFKWGSSVVSFACSRIPSPIETFVFSVLVVVLEYNKIQLVLKSPKSVQKMKPSTCLSFLWFVVVIVVMLATNATRFRA